MTLLLKWTGMACILLGLLPVSGFTQEAELHNGLPSVRYRGNHEYFIASVGQYQGEKAIIYEIGFQPSINHPWTKLGLLAASVASGSTGPASQADAINEADARAYPGKLYVCADRVAFVPSMEADSDLGWSMSHAQFSSRFQGYGLSIKAADKKDKSEKTGLVHFQPLSLSDESLVFQQPDEPQALHDKHMPDSIRSFLSTVQGSLDSFPETYNSLASKLNLPAF